MPDEDGEDDDGEESGERLDEVAVHLGGEMPPFLKLGPFFTEKTDHVGEMKRLRGGRGNVYFAQIAKNRLQKLGCYP